MVFVQSKERAQELFKELIYDGINVDVIHSDRTQTQVSWWKKTEIDFLCKNLFPKNLLVCSFVDNIS